jgi:DNA-binding winged helix-turn-helix (wHTH) protein/TolB-like protein
MERKANHLYEFGDFRLNVTEHLLWRDDKVVPLTPKAMEMLIVLVENSGHIVDKQALMDAVWPDAFVEETNLTRNIFTLRQTLSDDRNGGKYIETIPKRGYRFVASVHKVRTDSVEPLIEEQNGSHPLTTSDANEESKSEQWVKEQVLSGNPEATRGIKLRVNRVALAVCAVLVVAVSASSYLWVANRSKNISTATPIRTIAVLPFKPLIADRRDESLELGMADTLITRLGGTGQIVVRPITAVRKYTGIDQDPIAAGREQMVDAVFEGSIQWEGDKIRVTARLLSTTDGRTLWANRCEDQCTNIFEVQDSISEKLVRSLSLLLTNEEHQRLFKRHTDNKEAYQLYAKGRYHVYRRTGADAEKAVRYYQQAIALDSNYALAYAGLSYAYASLHMLGAAPAEIVWPKAKAAVEQALRIDNQLAEVHTMLGNIKCIYEWDWPGAERELTRAVYLNPNSAESRTELAYYLLCVGRFDEAIAEIKRALELDPTSLYINRSVGTILYMSRRYDEAIEQLQRTLDLDANFITTYDWIVRSYEEKGDYAKAIEWDMRKRNVVGYSHPENLTVLRKAYEASGWRGYWQMTLVLAKRQAQGNYSKPLQFAGLFARIGEKDQAFAWLERAFKEIDPGLSYLKVEPEWDNFRADPRFADLLRRIGLATVR